MRCIVYVYYIISVECLVVLVESRVTGNVGGIVLVLGFIHRIPFTSG